MANKYNDINMTINLDNNYEYQDMCGFCFDNQNDGTFEKITKYHKNTENSCTYCGLSNDDFDLQDEYKTLFYCRFQKDTENINTLPFDYIKNDFIPEFVDSSAYSILNNHNILLKNCQVFYDRKRPNKKSYGDLTKNCFLDSVLIQDFGNALVDIQDKNIIGYIDDFYFEDGIFKIYLG